MRDLYRQELTHLGEELESMSAQVARAIERATLALTEGDTLLAEQAIDAEERLDDAADEIAELCISLLLRQSPVAGDLRLTVAAFRLSQTMERMGDVARHLAAIARSYAPGPALCAPAQPLLAEMGQVAVGMARLMQELIATQDLSLASRIQAEDDILDELQVKVRRLVLDESLDISRQQLIDLVLAARFLERFGDHTVSVAKRIVYVVRGTAFGH